MSRPQVPEICAGLSVERRWSFAELDFTGRSSGSHELEQNWRPQRPTPSRRRASSRTPMCHMCTRVANRRSSCRTSWRKSTRSSAVK